MEIFPIFDENTRINENIWYVISGTGDLPFMRVGHTIVHIKQQNNLEDKSDKGELYLIGGANPAGCFDDVYKINLNSFVWSKFDKTKNLNSPRYEHACFVDNYLNPNSIYIFAGASQESNSNELNCYDLKKGIWSEIQSQRGSNKPCARTQHTSCVYKNQLVVFGGGKAGSLPVTDQQVHLYDPITNTWLSPNIKGKPPTIRHGHLMINFNDKCVYLHGGMNNQTFYDDLWILNFDTQNWSCVKQPKFKPIARAAHGGISTVNNLYIFGGLEERGNALGDFWSYDTNLNTWSIVKITGDNPPSRLDYAYCKLRLNYKFENSNSLSEQSKESKNEDIQKDLVDKIVTVLNVEQLKEQEEETEEQAQFILNNETVDVKNIINNNKIDNTNDNSSEVIEEDEVKEKQKEKKQSEITSLEESVKNLVIDVPDWVEREYFLIHGGMDTEGTIFDDCFIINLN
jgi:N-acetylneuraminic acid mutarotase